MDLLLMFEALEGGVIKPVKWNKSNFAPDTSIIILDEASLTVWLWHGQRQGLVARRTALRQAESLKGHGYTVGELIIGRDIKTLKEIDQRQVGRNPAMDKLYEEFEYVLNIKMKELEDFIVTPASEDFEDIKKRTTLKSSTQPKIPKTEEKKMKKKEKVKPKHISQKKVLMTEKNLPQTKPKVKKSISQKVSKPQPIPEKEITIRSSEVMDKISAIETTLNAFQKEFHEFKSIILDSIGDIPSIIKNLWAMKEAIRKNEELDKGLKFPTREEIINLNSKKSD